MAVALNSEYFGHIYNHHHDHCDEGITWYDYVGINSINIQNHYEHIVANKEILNEVELLTLPDDVISDKMDLLAVVIILGKELTKTCAQLNNLTDVFSSKFNLTDMDHDDDNDFINSTTFLNAFSSILVLSGKQSNFWLDWDKI